MKKLLKSVLFCLVFSISILAQSDSDLRSVSVKDRSSRNNVGKLVTLPASEHLLRGTIYFESRHFPEAREHFQKIFDNYPTDPSMSAALFMTGRSYYWERNYASCIPWLDRVSREYPSTKDGREGLYFEASCNLRVGKNDEAARLWQQYTVMYPQGERLDGAYVNTIDALREAGRYKDADNWVESTRQRFPGTGTETNALHARLRMQIFRGQYADAEATAALMQAQSKFYGSMTSLDEVKYLRAFALEKQKKRAEAMAMYASIANTGTSYFGGLAAEKVTSSGVKKTAQIYGSKPQDFPVVFRDEVLQYSRARGVDPRFVLAIMKQESTFKPDARSPSAAMGLLQLVYDTAIKYNRQAGYPNFDADDLYQPRVNIAIGVEYIAALKNQFGGLYEAVAASYNGGEDNAARWLARSNPKDPAIFASEVGFAETKNYVFKVMNNYRAYKDLYNENLARR
jgi:soluble lytic murein transglycosylase